MMEGEIITSTKKTPEKLIDLVMDLKRTRDEMEEKDRVLIGNIIDRLEIIIMRMDFKKN